MIRFGNSNDGGGGGGGTVTGGNNGVILNGANIQLGQAAAGSGASNFTANRFLYFGAFKFQFGGSAGNDLFKFDGNTGNFAINTTSPSAKAIFHITATDRGIIIPNLTTLQRDAITIPPTSLLIFNTSNNQYEFYNGSAWVTIGNTYSAGSGLTVGSNTFKLGAASSASGPADLTEHRYINLTNYLLRIFGTSSGTGGQVTVDGNSGTTSIKGSGADTIFVIGDNTRFTYLRGNNNGVTYSNEKTFSLINETAAADGAQQISPAIRWRGNGWKTAASAASQTVDFKADVLPVQGNANPTGLLRFGASINGAAYNENLFTIDDTGNIESYGGVVIGRYTPSAVNIVSAIRLSTNEANMGLAIVLRGTGSFMFGIPDNGLTGGNSRGSNSVDLQSATRSSSNQVASGFQSVILGGSQNRADGSSAVVLAGVGNRSDGSYAISGGNLCQASGNFSISTGLAALSYIYGMDARASGNFSTPGDAQKSGLVVRRNQSLMATGDTSALYTDGSSGLVIPSGSARNWTVQVWYNAKITAIAGSATGLAVGDSFAGSDLLYVTKVGGVTSIIGGAQNLFIRSVGGMSGATIAYSVGGSQNLLLTIAPPAFGGGGTITLKSVARIEIVENA